MQQSTVELSRVNLAHNIQTFQKLIRETNSSGLFCAVVKSNAYGHGILEISSLAIEAGAQVMGVNSPEEATAIRTIDKNIPILIMGDIPNLMLRAQELSDSNYWILVSRYDEWKHLAGLNPRPKIHIKVDTGMGRLGSFGEELEAILQKAKSNSLPLEGIATHFASTEDFTEHSYSQMQLKKFHEAIDLAKLIGYDNLIKHCAASASSLLFEDARLDMIRVGISLYGLWPSMETKLSMSLMNRPSAILKPVLEWKTKIQHIRNLPAGSYVGYGCTYKTTYPSIVGIVPVGYYEGLDRKLSNNGYMLVRGERARILGRICMNMTMLDLTHIPEAKIGEEVTIIGESGKEYLGADTISSWTGTINYETVTNILPLLPRRIVE
jgi:alanine racemase